MLLVLSQALKVNWVLALPAKLMSWVKVLLPSPPLMVKEHLPVWAVSQTWPLFLPMVFLNQVQPSGIPSLSTSVSNEPLLTSSRGRGMLSEALLLFSRDSRDCLMTNGRVKTARIKRRTKICWPKDKCFQNLTRPDGDDFLGICTT